MTKIREFSAGFPSFNTFQNDAFEGLMCEIWIIIVATWWKVVWTSEIPKKNSDFFAKFWYTSK